MHYTATCLVEPTGRLPEMIGLHVRDTLRTLATKQVRIILEEPKRYSSDPQRRYYFGVIVECIQHLFYENGTVISKDDMHHWLMEHVGKWLKEIITPNGEVTYMRRSYMDLNTEEAERHHTLCRLWGAEHGCDIPEPNEVPNV